MLCSPTLALLRAVGARLAVARTRRGGIRILREEAYITVDHESKEPTGIEGPGQQQRPRPGGAIDGRGQRGGRRGGWCSGACPACSASTSEPDGRRVEALAESAEHFGFAPVFVSPLTPACARRHSKRSSRAPTHEPVMRTVMTRVLGPARYTVNPSLHFGLAAPLYLHFTSPIRRYADLVVHRVVKGVSRRPSRHACRRSRARGRSLEHLNDRNHKAAKAERERKSALAARLFASKIGDQVRRHHRGGQSLRPCGRAPRNGHVGDRSRWTTCRAGRFGSTTRASDSKGRSASFGIGAEIAVQVTGADETLGRIELRPLPR